MTETDSMGAGAPRTLYPYGGGAQGSNLADILERVLDKGIVIVGDIKINLLDIELLTIKLRLLVASVDKAKEIGIDWWENDPALSSRADGRKALKEENERLRTEIESLRARATEAELPRSGRRGLEEDDGASTAPRKKRAVEGRKRES